VDDSSSDTSDDDVSQSQAKHSPHFSLGGLFHHSAKKAKVVEKADTDAEAAPEEEHDADKPADDTPE
jgi:hypothetical protein